MIIFNLTSVSFQQALPLYKLSITEKVVQAVQSMLLPQEGSLSIHTSLPATGDGSSPVMAAVRLLAEIRSRLIFPDFKLDSVDCPFQFQNMRPVDDLIKEP